MIDFLLLLNLPVFVYGIVAIMINWILKKDMFVADVFTAISVIAITIWTNGYVFAICGGIYTFLACYYRSEITLYIRKKFNKKKWEQYLNTNHLKGDG